MDLHVILKVGHIQYILYFINSIKIIEMGMRWVGRLFWCIGGEY